MPPVAVRCCYAALALGTFGIGALVGALDLAAYAYRLQRGLRNSLT